MMGSSKCCLMAAARPFSPPRKSASFPESTSSAAQVQEGLATVDAIDRHLSERLAEEIPLLRQAFPDASIDSDACVVILTAYRLPAGWSHEQTDILFAIPSNYPAGQPDNISRATGPHLDGGVAPGNNQGIQVYAGRSWLQFSYHVEPADWCPSANPAEGSNLTEYLTGALSRFEEAS